jgi:hypothetical protein
MDFSRRAGLTEDGKDAIRGKLVESDIACSYSAGHCASRSQIEVSA